MVSQVDEAFHFDIIVHGHHVYNRACTLFWGEIVSATAAETISSPSHHIFALAAVVAVPLTIKCSVYSREAVCYFALLFVKCSINSRAATKRGATSI